MSIETRIKALEHAVAVATQQGVDAVLTAAGKFHAFLEGTEVKVAAAATTLVKGTAAVAADKAAATKAAAAKPAVKAAAKAAPVKTEEQLAQEVVDAGVAADAAADVGEDLAALKARAGKLVADLLAANKRDVAVALLKKFGAKSISGVPDDDLPAFLEEGEMSL